MKMKILSMVILLLNGCSQKSEHSIQLEDNKRENISINILSLNKTDVPKDEFFDNKNWHYRQTKIHQYGYFFDNDEIVETFYLAHHASNIYIRGNEVTIEKYKNYFLDNQVKAEILLLPISTKRRGGKIIIDYFQITPIIAEEINTSFNHLNGTKALLPANSKVIEIPKNYIKKDLL